jgi:hypothetical protein
VLQRKLVIAITERDKQVNAFKEVSKTVSKEVRDAWKKMIVDWLADPTQTNPYTLKLKGTHQITRGILDLAVNLRLPYGGRGAIGGATG